MDVGDIKRGIKLLPKELGSRIFKGGKFNRIATNVQCYRTTARPNAFSLWSDSDQAKDSNDTLSSSQVPAGKYTTWRMLTSRDFSSRHLPPAPEVYRNWLAKNIPETSAEEKSNQNYTLDDLKMLFSRKKNKMIPSRSSNLFMFFAQWFTDSLLRVDPMDRRKNTSNHNIDLCQIYGLTQEVEDLLRSHEGGKLISRKLPNGEFPDLLQPVYEKNAWTSKDGNYKKLPYIESEVVFLKIFGRWIEKWKNSKNSDDMKRLDMLYATGLERGNSSAGYTAISTLFLREHNGICDALSDQYPDWDDERLFQTARMINTVILMKIVIVDYINHIANSKIFKFDPSFSEEEDWYRAPWIAIEFDMLYRWHGLVPDEIRVNDNSYDHEEYRFNNALLEKVGLETIIESASKEAAGEISLKNVPDFLLLAEYEMIKMGRDFHLQSYNAYRKHFDLRPIKSFEELTNDKSLRQKLKEIYNDIDNVEFIIGLFAEKRGKNRLFGDLMYNMVAYDAFTQIYTNPLLSQNVYNKQTFTELGLDRINKTNSLQDLVDRNTNGETLARFGIPNSQFNNQHTKGARQ